eukprot:gene34170-57997_t
MMQEYAGTVCMWNEDKGWGFVAVDGHQNVYMHISKHPFYDGKKGLFFKVDDRVNFTAIQGQGKGQIQAGKTGEGSNAASGGEGGGGDDDVAEIREGTLKSWFPHKTPPSGKLKDNHDGAMVYVQESELPEGYKPRVGDEFDYEELEDKRGRKYAVDARLVRRAEKTVFPRPGAVKTEAGKRDRAQSDYVPPPSRSRARRDTTPSHRRPSSSMNRPPPAVSEERGEGRDDEMAEPVSIDERVGKMMHSFLAAGGGMSDSRSSGRSMR